MHLPLALIPFPHINPVIVRLGPLAVRWYGVAYLLGFVACYLLLRLLIRRGRLRISVAQLSDLVTWLILGVLIGGRAGWWIFYHRATGAEVWYEPLATWRGGMSFHGGLAGVVLVMLIWCRRNKIALPHLADAAALVTPLGLFFGRLANFINGELVGRTTVLPWAMIFPNNPGPRHPSQLYEALLEGPLLMLCVWLVYRRRARQGAAAAVFIMFYGLFRFLVEFTRQPDEQLGFIAFGWLTMGQILSLAIVAIGATWLVLPSRAKPSTMEDRTGGPAKDR